MGLHNDLSWGADPAQNNLANKSPPLDSMAAGEMFQDALNSEAGTSLHPQDGLSLKAP